MGSYGWGCGSKPLMPILLSMTVDRWLHLWNVQDLVYKGETLTLPITGLYDNQMRAPEMAQRLSANCSCGEPGWGSDPSCHMGGSQLSIILAPRNSTPSSGPRGYCMHMVHRQTGKKPLLHIQKINLKKNRMGGCGQSTCQPDYSISAKVFGGYSEEVKAAESFKERLLTWILPPKERLQKQGADLQ